MSSLIVEVCKVENVIKHPNADRLEIVTVKGWNTCVSTGSMKKGDLCVYFPPDCVLPIPLSDRLNVTKYLSLVKDEVGNVLGARVKVARLRGQQSYGLIMAVEDSGWVVGQDVAEHYGITKWEPPMESLDGDAERPHPAFHHYFELENVKNFPDVIQDGEEVVFTEKIHGKNCRLGLILDTKDDGTPIWRFTAGSHDVRRKEMFVKRNRRVEFDEKGMPVQEEVLKEVRDESGKVIYENGEPKMEMVLQDKYWYYETTHRSAFFALLDTSGVRELLLHLSNGKSNVIIFGEFYGSGIQDMSYGFTNGRTGFRVFDISVNGNYLGFKEKVAICDRFKLQMVPILYQGPFSLEKVEEYVSGPTTVCDPSLISGFSEREGIVITTVVEHSVAHEKKFFDRAALKAINFAYLERNEGTEFH